MTMAPSTSVGELAQALERALDSDVSAARLKYAHTTVDFRLRGSDETVGLLLDDDRPRVEVGHRGGAIEIEFTQEQLAAFSSGELFLSVAVGRGQVQANGPVRRYLEVDPILRALLLRASGAADTDERSVSPSTLSANGHRIDPSLLAVQTEGLQKAFGAHRVLDGLDLEVPEGAVCVVLGPSGTGKSVLLQHIIGLLRPDAGDVYVRGESVGRMSRAELFELRESIGVMFQDGALLGTMSVYDNVAFPLRQHTDLREREIRDVVMDRLGTVGLADAADRMPNELSGGMRKRAGLARSLVMDPGILLCDEPDSGLDPVRTSLLADLLLAEHDRTGGTMLVVTHDISLARHVADHISIIWQGKVVVSGYAEEVIASEDAFVKQFLAGSTIGPLRME